MGSGCLGQVVQKAGEICICIAIDDVDINMALMTLTLTWRQGRQHSVDDDMASMTST
jgi:hypothetical protein